MRLTKAIRENVREPTDGSYVLLIGPNVWGRGKSVSIAFKNMAKDGYRAKDMCLAYHCHPDTYVAEDGCMVSPSMPFRVAKLNVKVGKGLKHEVY